MEKLAKLIKRYWSILIIGSMGLAVYYLTTLPKEPVVVVEEFKETDAQFMGIDTISTDKPSSEDINQ